MTSFTNKYQDILGQLLHNIGNFLNQPYKHPLPFEHLQHSKTQLLNSINNYQVRLEHL